MLTFQVLREYYYYSTENFEQYVGGYVGREYESGFWSTHLAI